MTIRKLSQPLTRRLRHRAQRGVAAVEFALVLLPMLLLAFGVVEYGRAIYQYNTLVKSVRTAVRLLSMSSPDGTSYRTDTVVRAKCLAVFGNESCTGTALAPSLTTAQVKVCDSVSWSECAGAVQTDFKAVASGQGPINLVKVQITGYQHPFLGLPLVTSSATTTFSTISAIMRQG